MKIGGIGGAGSSPMVDAIMEAERIPIQSATSRKEKTAGVKDTLKSFDGLLSNFGNSLNDLKNPSTFAKLAFESSHPDLIDGKILANAKPGNYEFEIEGLAKSEKQLAFGFPDADKSPVGFGFMRVGSGDLAKDLEIPPGSALKDVAAAINDADAGVKAMIVNTGMAEDPFRLMVSSLKQGSEAIVEIDRDTTFTEFKQIVSPQDLKAKFEGVDIKRATNSFSDLIEGVHLDAKRAEAGTKIEINIKNDVDKTGNGIKDFVKQYNELTSFAKTQSKVDPDTGKAGILSGDSSLRSSIRKLQSELGQSGKSGNLSLADIGITTDPFSGSLKVDESKLTDALSKNFDGVTSLFANSSQGPGLAQKLSESVKQLQDRQSGAIATRIKGLDQRIKTQDKEISRQEERLVTKRATLERTFASLDAKMAGMDSTSQFLNARFAPQAPKAAPAAKAVGSES
ncbi:MAG: flagellar filament capping protein FliD [Proteobacteria bacterium]|nr:flagellar filament capping protein FliD [Pseudomonadota bacterium]